MTDTPISDRRNFVLMGHTGAGKTTLVDSMLHKLGVVNQQGHVDNGTSAADITEEEKERKFTMWAKPFTGVYKTKAGSAVKMTIIDSPGYLDFFGQTIAAARVADTALIVVDANAGVAVGAQRAWQLCENQNLPRGIIITGLDRENADFFQSLSAVQESWGSRCVPVVLPNADLSAEYSVLMSTDVPADLQSQVDDARQQIVEAAAETDDTLIEKYLGGEELTQDELAHGLHTAVNSKSLVPVFAVAGKTEFGLSEVLEAICRYFPSPEEHGVQDADGNALEVGAEGSLSALVWRSINDPFAGQLSFVRVFAGTLNADGEIMNATKGHKEKVNGLLCVNGEKQEHVSSAGAGDIVALPKLRDTDIGDSICATGMDVKQNPIAFPNPVTYHAVVSTKRGEEDKLMSGLVRAAEDDPTIRVERNAETGDLILAGQGETQLDLAVQRMKKRTNVEVELRTPKVSYQETVTAQAEAKYRHKKQSGGRGQYGEVFLRVEPMPEGDEGEWFVNSIVGGAIPSNFIPAVQKGVVEGMEAGSMAHYPVKGVRTTAYDGSYHDVDSSEIAFKIAASRAFREAMSQARPVLREPIMKLRIMIPDQFMGDVNGDLSHKRGRVLGMEAAAGMQVIIAEAPQAELFRYSAELRSITGGRGSFEMEFDRYDTVPANEAQKVIQQREQEREEAD